MNKKIYEKPEILVNQFETENIMATSTVVNPFMKLAGADVMDGKDSFKSDWFN